MTGHTRLSSTRTASTRSFSSLLVCPTWGRIDVWQQMAAAMIVLKSQLVLHVSDIYYYTVSYKNVPLCFRLKLRRFVFDFYTFSTIRNRKKYGTIYTYSLA